MKKIIFIIELLALTVVDILNVVVAINQDRGIISPTSDKAWYYFYSTQILGINDTLWHFTILILLIPLIYSWFVQYKVEHISNHIFVRVDSKKWIFQELFKTLISGSVVRIFLFVVEIVTITFYYHSLLPIKTTTMFKETRLFVYFSNNTGTQFIEYVIFSIIGWGIWSAFIMSCVIFVKKTPLIIPVSLLITLILIIFPGILNLATSNKFSSSLSIILISYLTSPGLNTFGGWSESIPLYLNCILTEFLYLVIMILLTKTWLRNKGKIYGYDF